MAAATAAGAAAAAASISLFAYYLLFGRSGSKFPWTRTTGADDRRTRRKGLVEAVGNTPLIRINSLSDATGCEILGKAEFLNPGGSVKDRVAVKIIEEALKSGDLVCGGVVTEGSAGSTAISLATVAPAYGCRCHVVIPDDAAVEKSQIIEALGATVERVRPVSITHRDHFVNIARRRALEANIASAQRESNDMQTNGSAYLDTKTLNSKQTNGSAHASSEVPDTGKCYPNSDSKGGFFADQFENMANYRAHYEWTGPEIWKQTKGTVHAFVAAAGTGGTIAGVSRYLKEMNRNVRCFLMDPPGSGLFNKVTRGVMYTKEEAEGKRLKNPFDTITEGIGINRVTANFMMAELDGAYRGTDREAVEMSRSCSVHAPADRVNLSRRLLLFHGQREDQLLFHGQREDKAVYLLDKEEIKPATSLPMDKEEIKPATLVPCVLRCPKARWTYQISSRSWHRISIPCAARCELCSSLP